MYPYYDPYAVLGVAPTADLAEIKKVFRHLAKHHHPDVNPNDSGALLRFQEINRAYEILVEWKTNPPTPGYYPPYPPQPTGYTPPVYTNSPQQAPVSNDFQAFSWDSLEQLTQEQAAPVVEKKQPTPENPVAPVVEREENPGPTLPWREDLLQLSYEEAFRVAKDRALKKKYSPEDRLTQDIMVYLMRGKGKLR